MSDQQATEAKLNRIVALRSAPAGTVAKPVAPPPTEVPAAPAPIYKRAKSQDPAYKGFNLLLKIKTQAKAASIIKQLRTGEDLSDLTERLLAQWVLENEHKVE